MAANGLSVLMETICNAPFWVQEVIFCDIRTHLQDVYKIKIEGDKKDEIYPLYVPELTFKGKTELEKREKGLEYNAYKYMECVSKGMRIVDITLNNFWSLEESSTILAELVKTELIKNPANPVISASIFYLGNHIRLGEYVKRLEIINIDELDDILRKQKNYNEANPDTKLKIGEIMLEMGVVANQDIDRIIAIKNESKKRFIMKLDTIPNMQPSNVSSAQNEAQIKTLKQTISRLEAENKLFKDKLRAIFNIQSKKK